MATTAVRSELASGTQSALGYDTKLEVVTLPVSDVERGSRLDADLAVGEVRAVQFTPPHSNASITIGKGLTKPSPARFSIWSWLSTTSKRPVRIPSAEASRSASVPPR